jgi:hypothetical protein
MLQAWFDPFCWAGKRTVLGNYFAQFREKGENSCTVPCAFVSVVWEHDGLGLWLQGQCFFKKQFASKSRNRHEIGIELAEVSMNLAEVSMNLAKFSKKSLA